MMRGGTWEPFGRLLVQEGLLRWDEGITKSIDQIREKHGSNNITVGKEILDPVSPVPAIDPWKGENHQGIPHPKKKPKKSDATNDGKRRRLPEEQAEIAVHLSRTMGKSKLRRGGEV